MSQSELRLIQQATVDHLPRLAALVPWALLAPGMVLPLGRDEALAI
jgi:hypothetical protein